MLVRRNSWPLHAAQRLSLLESAKQTSNEKDECMLPLLLIEDKEYSSPSPLSPLEHRFLSLEKLKKFHPPPNSDDDTAGCGWTNLFSSQRQVLFAQQILIVIILIANIVLSIVGTVRFPRYGAIGTLYLGHCDVAKRLNLWFHLLINVLSTLLLGASNYSMQLLVSPTRKDIDRAHEKGKWLDIGISSVRNLWHIEKKKAVMWLLLGFSSTCLHFLWNSAVFYSIPVYTYTTAIATSEFFTNNATWNTRLNLNPGGTDLEHLREMGSSFERLNKTECIQRYLSPFTSGKDLIVVTDWTDNVQSMNDNTSLIFAFQNPANGGDWDTESMWVCIDNSTWPKTCNSEGAAIMATNWTTQGIYKSGPNTTPHPWSARIEYCLSAGTSVENANCGFHWSIVIMTLVSVLTLVKLVCICFVAQWCCEPSLITLGDAISNFLEDPDHFTKHMCLASNESFSTTDWSKEPNSCSPAKSLRWFTGASLRRWLLTLFSIVVTLLIATFLLYLSLLSLAAQSVSRSLPALWELGLGSATTLMVVGGWVKNLGGTNATREFFVSVIVANLPQVILSYLYLLYNGLLTCLLVAAQWTSFSVRRKGLRVSKKPIGYQRSGFFLSMPWRYGVLLSCASSIFHWLISQTMFLIRTAGVGADGSVDHRFDGSRIGYSPIGTVFLLGLGGVMIIFIVSLGVKKYPPESRTMPMALTSSAAISAACHRPDDDIEAHLLPVEWGEVEWDQERQIGHCSFTTAGDVKKPTETRCYA